MVVFTCNGCGEALRKNKVANHMSGRCRSASVSCIDCSKDFWGNEYDKHTSCISEAEKYSGKNFVPKANANKGQVKQDEWLAQVEKAIDAVKTNSNLRGILERMKNYPNIPRKEKAFKNFLRNSCAVWKEDVCTEVWNLIMAHTEKPKPQHHVQKQNHHQNSNHSNKSQANGEKWNNDQSHGDQKKMSKREKKELRKQQAHKSEKKDKVTVTENNDSLEGDVNKKKKKRKRDPDQEEEEGSETKKMKTEGAEDEEVVKETPTKPVKTKFRWQAVMLEAVQAKGEEMKIKKLRKKVLGEYVALGCTERPEDNLWAKFDKKLRCHPGLKVVNDRVKLAKT